MKKQSVNSLESLFTEGEVWGVIQKCDGNKAPGPDGFNLNFIKNQWGLIKGDVMKFLSEFHNSDDFDRCINSSFLTLIPVVPS